MFRIMQRLMYQLWSVVGCCCWWWCWCGEHGSTYVALRLLFVSLGVMLGIFGVRLIWWTMCSVVQQLRDIGYLLVEHVLELLLGGHM